MTDIREDGSFIATHACLNCGKELDAMSALGEYAPHEGAVAMCLYCGYPALVARVEGNEVILRDPDRAELASMLSDPEILRLLMVRIRAMESRS